MLKTRVITALVLLAVLLAVLFSHSYVLFALVAGCFFAAAAWESLRLFQNRQPFLGSVIWTAAFFFIVIQREMPGAVLLCGVSVVLWLIRFIPLLATGLPPTDTFSNRLLNGVYGIALLGCFVAIATLFSHSPLYLLSAMIIVWIADIGAYFAGKSLGKRKLAPAISPGKSWEGVMGGWLAVLIVVGGLATHPSLKDTFASHVVRAWGWSGFIGMMTLLVAFSVVGDLFESLLKRRVDMKDSSNLLPGHGGVLDRIDALIPTLPLVVLLDSWL